jgi:hypothetical protein
MRAGRVPVIISDEWVEPLSIDWESFSVRVRENEIPEIPSILREMEPRSEQMGTEARKVWEDNFSLENCGDWIFRTLTSIRGQQDLGARPHERNLQERLLAARQLASFYKNLI